LLLLLDTTRFSDHNVVIHAVANTLKEDGEEPLFCSAAQLSADVRPEYDAHALHYHVVALTSSTYEIMKLVEAEKYAVNEEELLESNLVLAGCDHHLAAVAAAASGMYSKIMRKSESMPARSSKPAPH
jgi:hypothetical protein